MTATTAANPIPIAKPWITEEEELAVATVLRSRWLTQGPQVAQFEADFASYVGAPHAVAVSSCTTGLQLVLQALGIQPGDEVVCPSLSFIATANSIVHAGATAVFVDVDEQTHNVSAETALTGVGPRTKALLVAHQIGLPADLDELAALACERGLFLIEDAACAAGSSYKGAAVGHPHGIAAVFSFHPRKVLTTGEGGMITTRDAALAAKLRVLRHHGMQVSDLTRHAATAHYPQEDYGCVGYNYRMTDLQAAVGQVQLRKLREMVQRRAYQAAIYAQALADLPSLKLPYVPSDRTTNHQSYLVRLSPESGESNESLRQRRDALIDELLREGISTRPGVMAAHLTSAYRQRPLPKPQPPLPNTELIAQSGIVLPLFHELTETDQRRVAESLRRRLGERSAPVGRSTGR
jgi:dTDP-4-amino-4,6-dideoxygalactose transaminase